MTDSSGTSKRCSICDSTQPFCVHDSSYALVGEIERLHADLADAHEIIRESVAAQEAFKLRAVLIMVRNRFFPADQPERDRDQDWDVVNGALANSPAETGVKHEGSDETERLRVVLTMVRNRFFPADQPERDRDEDWDVVNAVLRRAGEEG